MVRSPESPSPGPAIGGRYTVLEKLGSGSLGAVYLAQDASRQSLVALKVIRTDRLTSQTLTHLRDEFQAILTLRHPQIASALDFGYTEGDVPFYTREYIPGVPLPPGPPVGQSPCDFLRPVLDLLDALDYVHSHGILHLDVHAGNLIVANDSTRGAVLIDFGVLGSAVPGTSDSGPHPVAGLPPELLAGQAASSLSDIFLAGRLLLYRLTGQLDCDARLPREIPGWGARLTLELERIAAKALEPQLERRFASAREFHAELLNAIGERRATVTSLSRQITVGRERELREIDRRLQAAAERSAALVLLRGTAGIGKSHLLDQARVRAQILGLEVVEVSRHGDPTRGPRLVHAIRRSSSCAATSWTQPLDTRHGGSPSERAERAAEAFFCQKGRPLALVVDDLDRIDHESLLVVSALAAVCAKPHRRILARGLCIVAATSGTDGFRAPRRDRIALRPLGRTDSATLLQELLRPSSVPPAVSARAVECSGGNPLQLQRVAAAVRDWRRQRGRLPNPDDIPGMLGPIDSQHGDGDFSPCHQEDVPVVAALFHLGRPLRAAEIAAAVQLTARETAAALRRLRSAARVTTLGRGPSTRYLLSGDAGVSVQDVAETQRMHQRVARYLEQDDKGQCESEHLARHLLATGERERGVEVALAAAQRLREAGSVDRAVRLVQEASEGADIETELRLAEEMSSILEEVGDHTSGVEILEPIYRERLPVLSPRRAMRLMRRLGIHYHRTGQPDRALSIFEAAQRFAGFENDQEDLIFIDSELAEIHTFRGDYVAAEDACRRGLQRLEDGPADETFRVRMETVLRASLGHLELRRLRLPAARHELEAAMRLSQRFSTTAGRAAILNNLGVTANQQNDFVAAHRYFERAQRMLLAAGERRGTIKIAVNLAIISAKLGDAKEARTRLESARELLLRHPGKRHEFFVAYAGGLVPHFLGDARGAIEGFAAALPMGRRLGDEHLVSFGEVYLAEALMAAGRYQQALRELRATARHAKQRNVALLSRMVRARLYLLEALLGRVSQAKRSRQQFEAEARTDMDLLEAWNDVFVCAADIIVNSEALDLELRQATAVFQRLGVSSGGRCASLLALICALVRDDRTQLRVLLTKARSAADADAPAHSYLAVAEPLARAEAAFRTGDLELAGVAVNQASGGIVGLPFLELDWRIDFLRARMALQLRDREEARRHLHRSLHTRDLLVELVPPGQREQFLTQARFVGIDNVTARLRRSPCLAPSTELVRRAASHEGIVGESPAMLEVLRLSERLSDQELPVLIEGETGTGKEVIARAFHRRSPRRDGRFMAVHCAALPEELFDVELFGAAAGAYTGATSDRPGLLGVASGGTLFLDEVGQLAPGAQAKLAQTLESGTYRPLGSLDQLQADVRFLAATSEDLGSAVADGRFRRDLYLSLGAVRVELPPLRKRSEDIEALAAHLTARHAQKLARPGVELSPGATEWLGQQKWPGNVRELEMLLLRVLVTHPECKRIERTQLERCVEGDSPATFGAGVFQGRSLTELKSTLEREYITHVFLEERGDLQAVAEKLGVKRSRLYAWLRQLELTVEELRKRL